MEKRAVVYTDENGRAYLHGEMNEDVTKELQEIQELLLNNKL